MVDIVMATYNGEKYIREQIDSIINGTYKDVRFIIYDDCSTDGTLNILKEYEDSYPGLFEIIKNDENKGPTVAFLSALKETKSDYIFLADQDDYWYETRIEDMLEVIKLEEEKGEKLIGVFSDSNVCDDKLKIKVSSFYENEEINPYNLDLSYLIMENKVRGASLCVTGEIRKYLKSIPEGIKMYDWWLALIIETFGKLKYYNKQLMAYRQHRDNVIGSINKKTYFINKLFNIFLQRKAIYDNIYQAKVFYFYYKSILPIEEKKILENLIILEKSNFIKKRFLLLKGKYLKTSIIKNIAIFMLI